MVVVVVGDGAGLACDGCLGGCVRNREKRSRAELENSVGTLRYIKGHQAQNVKNMGYMGHCT